MPAQGRWQYCQHYFKVIETVWKEEPSDEAAASVTIEPVEVAEATEGRDGSRGDGNLHTLI